MDNNQILEQKNVFQGSIFNFDKIFKYLPIFFLFLIPIFFIPNNLFSLYSSKILLIVVLGIVTSIALFLKIFNTKVVSIPNTKIFLPIAIFTIIALVSSFFSNNPTQSVVGDILDLGTSGFFLLLTLLMFLVSMSIKNDQVISRNLIKVFLISNFVVSLYVVLKAFIFSYLPIAVLSKLPPILIGSYVDMSIILSSGIIASVFMLSLPSTTKRFSYFLYVSMFLSIIVIGSVNFIPIMWLLAILSLIYLVRMFSDSLSHRDPSVVNKSWINYLPIIFVLIFSVLILLPGNKVSSGLAQILEINTIEVRPNFEVTKKIIAESWKINPILGVGPNNFSELWNLHKPLDVNIANFWNSEFRFGSSLITTLAASTGILGLASIMVFILFYLVLGYKSLFKKEYGEAYTISNIYFFISILFWLICFVYTPGLEVLYLAFIFSAFFILSLVSRGLLTQKEVVLFSDNKRNFLQIMLIVLSVIFLLIAGFFVIRRNVAGIILNKAIVSINNGDIQKAKTEIASAIKIASLDVYWRSLSEVTLLELSKSLEGVPSSDSIDDSKMIEIQGIVSNAIEAAKSAVSIDDANYKNWFNLARVYETLASLGVEGALINSKNSYLEAQKRMPTSPEIPLAFARINMLSGNIDSAREEISKALELKNNYTNAYFTLAQIESASGNTREAIRSIENATVTDPYNYNLYLQLGLMKYETADFLGAVDAFEKVIILVPDYANAKYFLGLSYDKINRSPDAIKQFEEIEKTNPDNQEVKFIISNLRAGKDPFYNAEPPIDANPEDREELPIE